MRVKAAFISNEKLFDSENRFYHTLSKSYLTSIKTAEQYFSLRRFFGWMLLCSVAELCFKTL